MNSDLKSHVSDVSDNDTKDKVHTDVWSELENKVRVGMQFESKKQVKKL